MSPIVELKNVTKSFSAGRIQVLKGVTFSVKKGQVAAIIGQSGSGKSTALRCMNRLENIDSGEVNICGHALHDPALELRALRRDVGIVFQSYNLFPHLTAEENVGLALKLVRGKTPSQARNIARDMLGKVGLSEKADSYPEQLSGGQQQRVAIARSLAMEPKLMLFDEVTSALDPKLTGEVLHVIEDLARDGMTMVLVTHEMRFAQEVADVVIYMRDGCVHEMGDPQILSTPGTAELTEFLSHE